MYQAAQNRYNTLPTRRCGNSGLLLPAVSLGLWHNFGDTSPYENMRALCRTAFDNGITHFDLANNYGPEPGAAERNFGRILHDDLGVYRDELMGRPLRQLGQPQIPAGQPGSEPAPHGAGLCGYFLPPPHGS